MAQITLRIGDEDLERLKAHARMKALRPLTYASYLLTTSIRGHDMFGDLMKNWEDLESTTQHVFACKAVDYDKSKLDPKAVSNAPEDLEEKFGAPKNKPADRWNPMTGKYEDVECPD